jgi:SAM-dependent methyltransferase
LQPSIGARWLIRTTRRYLKPEECGTVLEGGCGTGYYVAALQRAGYKTVGIDFAPRTVAMLNRVAPELDIRLGDVRRLPFEEGTISGYWSIGLIEHFFSGYQPLAVEMARVIRSGGYLFLIFPYLSPVRRLKARLGLYPSFAGDGEPAGFYQFALDLSSVTSEFEKLGFQLCSVRGQAGLKGSKDEIRAIRAPLQKLYNYPGRSFVLRGLRWGLDPVLAVMGCGHSCVLVLKRV